MNTFTTAVGVVYLQLQLISTILCPSSPTAVVSPRVVVQRWGWKEMLPERAAKTGVTDRDVERVGKIYAELAGEDAKLAEMGMTDYGSLLDHDLVAH